ncbi:hypothetical protein O181_012928 [Austropuccinia psidii MF-1]|uniref:CCHC-type domain-containing protein n=1 Tax=Austropuccinia psidii MF-1 TaxID=1389203 RepID=A0A9Q3GMM8_9BASI|nr:hypothetical protein [Austropuccinia psidii MF-1]
MSQFAEKTQKQFAELKAIHERLKKSTASLDKIVKNLQELHAHKGVAEVAKKTNSCQICGSTDHYAKNCPKANEKVYAIEKVLEEESPTKESSSDSMGDAIREQYDEEQEPREEFLVEYQEETP